MKRKNAGFTLIELAIVLVVIGLIIAAVLKGEDLIQNARMLNFVTNPVQKAQVAAMAYYDRTGQYPSGTTSTGALLQMYNAGIDGVLDLNNPFTKGSTQLGIALTTITDSNTGSQYPAIVVTPVTVSGSGSTATVTASNTWNASALAYANYLKSRLDGNTNNWSTGSVRFVSTAFAPAFNSLQTEIGNSNITTNAFDGYFTYTPTLALTGANAYTTPTISSGSTSVTGTLLVFYSTQPH